MIVLIIVAVALIGIYGYYSVTRDARRDISILKHRKASDNTFIKLAMRLLKFSAWDEWVEGIDGIQYLGTCTILITLDKKTGRYTLREHDSPLTRDEIVMIDVYARNLIAAKRLTGKELAKFREMEFKNRINVMCSMYPPIIIPEDK